MDAFCPGGDHRGVEVACAFGVDLHDGHPDALHPLGIDRAGDVAFDDCGPDRISQGREERFQERGLACTRRTDDVHDEDAGGIELYIVEIVHEELSVALRMNSKLATGLNGEEYENLVGADLRAASDGGAASEFVSGR